MPQYGIYRFIEQLQYNLNFPPFYHNIVSICPGGFFFLSEKRKKVIRFFEQKVIFLNIYIYIRDCNELILSYIKGMYFLKKIKNSSLILVSIILYIQKYDVNQLITGKYSRVFS